MLALFGEACVVDHKSLNARQFGIEFLRETCQHVAVRPDSDDHRLLQTLAHRLYLGFLIDQAPGYWCDRFSLTLQ